MARSNHPSTLDHAIVLFDGVCNMCSGIARFLIARDRTGRKFKFSALQSEAGQRLLREHGLSADDLETFVLIEGGSAHVRSAAALRVMRRLGFPWSLACALSIVPRPLRDWVYRLVARHRYRWFGKRASCMAPTPEMRARFLE